MTLAGARWGLALGTMAGLAAGCEPRASEPPDRTPVPATRPGRSCEASDVRCRDGDCCAVELVPGGTVPFGRGFDEDLVVDDAGDPVGASNEDPEVEVAVAPYFLDRFEVTRARFAVFAASRDGWAPPVGAGSHRLHPGSGWSPAWNAELPTGPDDFSARAAACERDNISTEPTMAQTCVSWFEAYAFCIWDGGRLPTAAEWEFAAAGGDANRPFPWGDDDPDCERSASQGYTPTTASGAPLLQPVGSLPKADARWGHADLAGSVLEWTLDDHVPAAHERLLTEPAPNNPYFRNESALVDIRSSYYEDAARFWQRPSSRRSAPRSNRTRFLGFRCARAADDPTGR